MYMRQNEHRTWRRRKKIILKRNKSLGCFPFVGTKRWLKLREYKAQAHLIPSVFPKIYSTLDFFNGPLHVPFSFCSNSLHNTL